MWALCRKIVRNNSKLVKLCRQSSQFGNIILSEEVRTALHEDTPLVALESTIITHGMPFPENVKCALDVEAVVRKEGAIPATIAIINGQVKVGLDENEIQRLGDTSVSKPIKTSRRDFSYVVSTGRNGGTTVSGTLVVAVKVGIPIFATGGIGGVHRKGETTFDVSADLIELGRSNVAVVCSGVKSILDIPKTLEYLETQGVFVASFGSEKDFPAFYSRKSGCYVPYSVETAQEAAKIIHCNRKLDLRSGMLFAVPVPEMYAMDSEIINGVIDEALKEAESTGIGGKDITPFLLKRIGDITSGKSLETNVALIKNNAKTAAIFAVNLTKLNDIKSGKFSEQIQDEVCGTPAPVIIGGSNLDCTVKLEGKEIKLDGSIHFGKSVMTGGGVARNICESLTKLGCRPFFISVVGNDPQGNILKNFIPQDNRANVKVLEGRLTAQCTVILDCNGECKFLAGDMEIHKCITPQMILEKENVIKKAPLLVFDANLDVPAIETILEIAGRFNIPVLFEPTDLAVCTKPFLTNKWKAIQFITPNKSELIRIAEHFGIVPNTKLKKFDQIVDIATKLVAYVENIIVTIGIDGVIVARRGKANESFLCSTSNDVEIRHYAADRNKEVVSVTGAGDNLTSGIIAGIVNGASEQQCISIGLCAAECTISVPGPVPETLFGKNHHAWSTPHPYKTLLNVL